MNLALLRLATPLDLSDPTVEDIPYATQEDERRGRTDPGTTASVTGWGGDGVDVSLQLQVVDIPIISNSNANEQYADLIESHMIVAGEFLDTDGGKGPCLGDSGGPLTVPNANGDGAILAGIVSFRPGNPQDPSDPSPCGWQGFPGVFTRVSHFEEWIKSQTGIGAFCDGNENYDIDIQLENRYVEATNQEHTVQVKIVPNINFNITSVPQIEVYFGRWEDCYRQEICGQPQRTVSTRQNNPYNEYLAEFRYNPKDFIQDDSDLETGFQLYFWVTTEIGGEKGCSVDVVNVEGILYRGSVTEPEEGKCYQPGDDIVFKIHDSFKYEDVRHTLIVKGPNYHQSYPVFTANFGDKDVFQQTIRSPENEGEIRLEIIYRIGRIQHQICGGVFQFI